MFGPNAWVWDWPFSWSYSMTVLKRPSEGGTEPSWPAAYPFR